MRHSRHIALAAAVVAISACAGSNGVVVTGANEADSAPTIDLADGAVVHDGTSDGTSDGASVGASEPEVGTSGSTSAPTDEGDDAPESPSIDEAGSPDSGADTAEATTVATVPTPEASGVVTIGSTTYSFTAETCDVASDFVIVAGEGSSDGSALFVWIYFEQSSGDDADDATIEVNVVLSPNAADQSSPDYFVSTERDDHVIEHVVDVDAQRITGSGSIFDLNGVTAADDVPQSMTFDVRCS